MTKRCPGIWDREEMHFREPILPPASDRAVPGVSIQPLPIVRSCRLMPATCKLVRSPDFALEVLAHGVGVEIEQGAA